MWCLILKLQCKFQVISSNDYDNQKKTGLENKVGTKIMTDRRWRDNDKKYTYMKGVPSVSQVED